MSRRRGPNGYASEELVAEMVTAFVCASLGIVPIVRHSDYIGSWLQVLKEDSRAIFRAESQASKGGRGLEATFFAADVDGVNTTPIVPSPESRSSSAVARSGGLGKSHLTKEGS